MMIRTISNVSKWIFLLFVVLGVVFLSSCGNDLKETTSDAAGLYLLGDSVVGYDGNELVSNGAPMYGISKEGDIVSLNDDNEVVVYASNTKDFTYVSDVSVDEEFLEIKIPTVKLDEDEFYYEPVTWKIEMKASPADTMNKEITVKSTDTFMLYVDQKCDCVAAEVDCNNIISLEVTACYPGEHKLEIYDVLGNKIDTLTINVTEDLIEDKKIISEIKEEIENCDHNFSDEIVPATENSKGYTVHKCSKCGDSYRDNYTSKLTKSTAAGKNATMHTQKPELP